MNTAMISVTEASEIINSNTMLLPAVEMFLPQAAGHVLAQDIFAEIDVPPFEQSSMDGYAIKFNDRNTTLIVHGEMAAGTSKIAQIKTGEAARIFTGAPLPQGADTVVMQEKVLLKNGTIIIEDVTLKHGSNVRSKGAEIKAGSLALQKNCYLSPAAIGFLAGMGCIKVLVYPMPSVTIIVTGNELQKLGNALLPGQVYESNSFSLVAALNIAGVKNINILMVTDSLLLLEDALAEGLQSSDVILLTGGVSVGDYDFVVQATVLCGVQQHFHKVKQRPGKPLYFGTKNKKLVFGLPGNPSSVLSCFYNFVLPALESLCGKKNSVQKINASLTKNCNKQKGLTHFLKGVYNCATATPLLAQESFQLSSFAQADCLICLEEQHGDYVAGETVQVLLLPS